MLLDQQLLALPDQLLDLIPAAVYVCDRDGIIVRYNRRAAELWGRAPEFGDPEERFCGSHRLYRLDGGPLPHDECPMADVLRTGIAARDQELVIERPDGSCIFALASIDLSRMRLEGSRVRSTAFAMSPAASAHGLRQPVSSSAGVPSRWACD